MNAEDNATENSLVFRSCISVLYKVWQALSSIVFLMLNAKQKLRIQGWRFYFDPTGNRTNLTILLADRCCISNKWLTVDCNSYSLYSATEKLQAN